MDFSVNEEINGVRFSWNVFPPTKADASMNVVPVGCLYTPLAEYENLPIAEYNPTACAGKNCKSILNPYCQIDTANKAWVCNICYSRNGLPMNYINVTPENKPLELQYTTMEYITNKAVLVPPIFFFVIDITSEQENLDALKQSIITSLTLLPPNALIGLITYGNVVQLHDLSSETIDRCNVFRGDREYQFEQLVEMLTGQKAGNANLQGNNMKITPTSLNRFFLPLENIEFKLNQLLENLTPDQWSIPAGHRPARATGSAMNIATLLLQGCYKHTAARIILFASGPGTIAPGMIVTTELKDPLRSHNDIDSDRAVHYKKASKFYNQIANRVSDNGHTVDIFAGCYDQVGMSEMQQLTDSTGGVLLLTDAFSTAIFKQSYIRLFSTDEDGFLRMAFNGVMSVKTSKNVKIQGLIGHATAMEKSDTSNVSETEIGIGGVSTWKMSALSPNHTYAIYYDFPTTAANSPQGVPGQPATAYTQFITAYQHSSGTNRIRVTTVGNVVMGNGNQDYANSFDQEAAAVLMARIAVSKAEADDGADVIRWIDRTLIKLCQRYANYDKDLPETFTLVDSFRLYPQFTYYLRRSQFLSVFNNSPDETAFYRHIFTREDTTNSLIMIQPTLTSFSMEEDPHAVLLDSISVKPNTILLLDTFFFILIYHGEQIAQWRKAGYQDNPDYAAFKSLLEEPKVEAAELLVDRFPLPRFIDTEHGGSQARFLLSKLNPSDSYQDRNAAAGTLGTIVLTDDISLQSFMQHLKQVTVGIQN
ncbi:similar to Saccharomyces cerevisiae YPR181C SEC23 GTPase-activating protein, stimulates the GTPase activity of Sar1p [Maudiozyma barnettii]|uniref:Protein transport protein SEC23 n=1 Tax=Maudiozyma barnettii TaxID=61262 RepID=A0A8H2ZJ55_9SACH|nr:GTPase-activating protein SEC23 [Kazachstania barnettii]CAB4253912.1 similar to Saccharomyces cerevisiae YPR181C SEC23 GTPase-activating protein, stimulates the GTPase activity of Sar1p [Kazachstania barnettii]CAD1781662.1 similar to Saccharomyces cerevisiae YPR181C SEC23 GTPase-activating protein, stimulates the GTPase activity of Sar1p [Kazachstania barnettii]